MKNLEVATIANAYSVFKTGIFALIFTVLFTWCSTASASLSGFSFEGRFVDVAGEQNLPFTEERAFWNGFIDTHFYGNAIYPNKAPISQIDDTTSWNYSRLNVQTNHGLDFGAGLYPLAFNAGGGADSLTTIVDDCSFCPIALDSLSVNARGPSSLTVPAFPGYNDLYNYLEIQFISLVLQDFDGFYPGGFWSGNSAPSFSDLPPLNEFESAYMFIKVASPQNPEYPDIMLLGEITHLGYVDLPEPSVLLLFALALAGLGMFSKQKSL